MHTIQWCQVIIPSKQFQPQVTIFNTTNLPSIQWCQVIILSKQFQPQVTIFNTTNLHTIQWCQVIILSKQFQPQVTIFNIPNLHTIQLYHVLFELRIITWNYNCFWFWFLCLIASENLVSYPGHSQYNKLGEPSSNFDRDFFLFHFVHGKCRNPFSPYVA